MKEALDKALAEALRQLGNEFKANRLAHWSLTSKNEQVLCSALASSLHEAFIDSAYPVTQIRREWPMPRDWPIPKDKTRAGSVDVAVLRDAKPAALVEAKAAMSFDLVKGGKKPFPIEAVRKDACKLKFSKFEGARYVLLFVTHNHKTPPRKYKSAMPYYWGMENYAEKIQKAYNSGCFEYGFERIRYAAGDLNEIDQGEVHAGEAFGVRVSVLYRLWGLERTTALPACDAEA